VRKKIKSLVEVKCDYCHSYTSSFVVTVEHKIFCKWQTTGFPPDVDCMSEYLKNLNPIHSKNDSKPSL